MFSDKEMAESTPTPVQETPSKVLEPIKNPCLKRARDQLYKDCNRTGDVTFIVESQEIRAHRNILAAVSPKYDAQFYGSMTDTGNINVEDVSAAAFNEFLQFFYTEEVALTIESIDGVLNLAKQSLVIELVDECTKFLINTVDLDRVITYLQLALVHNLKLLQDKCDDLISTNTKEVFKATDFLSCERETLRYILSLDTLICKETEVFEASMEWARSECERQNIDGTKAENIRSVLGDVFFMIRFGVMSTEEFGTIHKLHPGLFTMDESFELFYVTGKVKDAETNSFSKTKRQPKSVLLTSIRTTVGVCDEDLRYGTSANFKFTCDKSIHLNGIIIPNPYIFLSSTISVDDFTVSVSIGKFKAKNCASKIKKSDEEIILVFDKPIRIRPEQICCITINTAPMLSLYRCNDLGFVLEPVDIEFDFPKNGHIPITQLLFNFMDMGNAENLKQFATTTPY